MKKPFVVYNVLLRTQTCALNKIERISPETLFYVMSCECSRMWDVIRI